jgi:hypothetical protein
MDEGQANGILPELAARKIIRGIIGNRREILVGRGNSSFSI